MNVGNNCTYCGFSYDRDIDRYTLSDVEIIENVQILVNKGFQHILLLTGEAAKTVEMTYFERVLPLIRPMCPAGDGGSATGSAGL